MYAFVMSLGQLISLFCWIEKKNFGVDVFPEIQNSCDQLGQVMQKCVLWHMRTTKVQISLRIRAV